MNFLFIVYLYSGCDHFIINRKRSRTTIRTSVCLSALTPTRLSSRRRENPIWTVMRPLQPEPLSMGMGRPLPFWYICHCLPCQVLDTHERECTSSHPVSQVLLYTALHLSNMLSILIRWFLKLFCKKGNTWNYLASKQLSMICWCPVLKFDIVFALNRILECCKFLKHFEIGLKV